MNQKHIPEGMPTRWAICGCCEGNGKVENPAFSNGITSDEWNDWDQDDREGYLSGRYDVLCDECRGAGKVRVLAVDRMTFAQKRAAVELRREERAEAEWRRDSWMEREAARRMGC